MAKGTPEQRRMLKLSKLMHRAYKVQRDFARLRDEAVPEEVRQGLVDSKDMTAQIKREIAGDAVEQSH